VADEQPRFRLGVASLPAWLAFFERAGFPLVARHADHALLRTPRGALFALGAEGMRPGEVNYVHPDVAALAAAIPGAELTHTSWGDRVLTTPAPDGTLRFIQPAEHPPAELFRRYLAGPDELEAALAGLSEAELDRPGPGGGWSIRQIAHHPVYGELLWIGHVRMALAEPGREYVVSYGSKQAELAEASRPLEPTLALLRALRAYLRPIVEAIPDALDRYTVDAAGNRTTVADSLAACARHLAEHTDEIRSLSGRARP
jgi:hypothetical protein